MSSLPRRTTSSVSVHPADTVNTMLTHEPGTTHSAPLSLPFGQSVSCRLAALVCLPCLLLLPACALPGSLKTSADHVYSKVSPSGLSQSTSRAEWPNEQFPPTPAAAAVQTSHADYGDTFTQNEGASTAEAVGVAQVAADSLPADDALPIVDAKVMRVSYETGAATSAATVHTSHPLATYAQAEPRVCDPAQPAYGIPAETVGAALVDSYPEEYIFDGGDRGTPVHYVGGSMQGLETEDTVVEYTNRSGEHRVRPSNRVAVYAPRFGSVRTVAGPHNDVKVDTAVGTVDVSGVGNLLASNGHAQSVEHTLIEGLAARSRADGVETDIIPHASEQTDLPHQSSKADAGHENRATSAAGTLHVRLTAKQRQHLQNAVSWTRDTFPQVSAATSQATQIRATFKPEEVIGLEDQRKDGPLRIIKLADKETAQTGEIITFTIHYQNLSDFEVSNVRIIDNLTPRLEYIQDSARADREGDTSVEPNGEGSHRLVFEFDEPLPGQASGTIVFSARVR